MDNYYSLGINHSLLIDTIIDYNVIGEIQLVEKLGIDRKVEIVFNFSISQ